MSKLPFRAANSTLSATGAVPAARRPSLMLPSGVQTVVVLLKGTTLQLECIPEGLYVPPYTLQPHLLNIRSNKYL